MLNGNVFLHTWPKTYSNLSPCSNDRKCQKAPHSESVSRPIRNYGECIVSEKAREKQSIGTTVFPVQSTSVWQSWHLILLLKYVYVFYYHIFCTEATRNTHKRSLPPAQKQTGDKKCVAVWVLWKSVALWVLCTMRPQRHTYQSVRKLVPSLSSPAVRNYCVSVATWKTSLQISVQHKIYMYFEHYVDMFQNNVNHSKTLLLGSIYSNRHPNPTLLSESA
jgi:hypothetical protein